MKIVYIITTLVFVLAMAWVLAFIGIIPAQKIANKNAVALKVFKALHLAKDPPKPKPVVAKSTPPPAPDADNPIKKIAEARAQLDAQKAELDDEKAQLDAEKSQIDSSKTSTASKGDRQKLISIYSTMSPDDIAQILTDVPDKAVLADLMSMDEKKAGKVLAAMPADRAAKISEMMAGSPIPKSPPAASSTTTTTPPSTQTAAAAPLPKKAL